MFTRNLDPRDLPWLMLADDGGEGGGGGGDAGDGGTEGEGGAETEAGSKGKDTEGGDETVTMSKAEADQLRKDKAAADRARKRAEGELNKRTEQEHRDAGELEKVVTQKDEKIGELEAELASLRVGAIATKLNFHDPADVVNRPELADVDKTDEGAIESALKGLAREKKYLIREPEEASTRRRQAVGVGGGNGAVGADMDLAIRKAAGRA